MHCTVDKNDQIWELFWNSGHLLISQKLNVACAVNTAHRPNIEELNLPLVHVEYGSYIYIYYLWSNSNYLIRWFSDIIERIFPTLLNDDAIEIKML